MHAAELVERLRSCDDEELADVAEDLSRLLARARRRAVRAELARLAQAAAAELRDEPPLDEAGIRSYLGRDRETG